MAIRHTGTMVFLFLVLTTLLWGQTTDLFFSEYVEGSSYNKAVEIYNGTGAPVDLSQYTIELYSNGNSSPNSTTSLSGALADGDVFVAAHSSADAAILAVADMTNGSVINFNGDDAFALRKNGALVDVIGQIGTDPGSQWGSGDASTADNTIRRKSSVCSGDINGSDAFDPSLEWDGYPSNTFDGLGSHTTNCSGGPTTTSIYDIQYTTDPRGDSPENGQTVNTEGVVTAIFSGGYFIQDGAGAWNGIYVYDSSNTPAVGDLVSFTATVAEYYHLTELTGITDFQVLSSGNALPAAQELATGSVADEQWEGCLVKVSDVTITNADLGYGEWSVSDGSGDVRVDDRGGYTYVPSLDNQLKSITGPLDYSFSTYKIQPRDDNDILEKPPVNLVLTGIVDGPLSGGIPKAIEFYVISDISDLSVYGVGSANNGGGSNGVEFTFPVEPVTAGTFLYISYETTGFNTFFGFAPNYTSAVANNNGNDAIELFLDGEVVDVFGDINVDGSGQPWEYTDGWAYRKDFSGPDGSTFVLDNWTFSGINALDNETTNATATTPFPISTFVDPSQKPEIFTSESTHDFGYRTVGEESGSWSYTVSSVNVSSSITVTSNDGDHFQVSDDDVSFSSSITLPSTGGIVYVRFTSSDMLSYSTIISHSTNGADDLNVTVEGNSDYYATTVGKTGTALKDELHNIIKGHTIFSYSDVWDAMRQTDADPANPDNVILIYTGRSQDADYRDQGTGVDYSQYDDGAGTLEDSYNREHVWAKSHGFPDESDVAYTDLHHLRPADRSVNSSRSENDFDWGTTPHPEATECKTATNIWEPRNAVKGDVARMMFYMATRYEAEDGYDLELVDYVGTEPGDEVFGNVTTLLEWHTADPVDDWERRRNNIIDEYWQGNRNPFIDHPEFVSQIWSDPISIELTNFSATWIDDVVKIKWTVTQCNGCAGFNIYRQDDEQTGFTKINDAIIVETNNADSLDYLFRDANGSLTSEYRLESVGLDGSSTFLGPITVSSVTDVETNPLPNNFALHHSYPNPFNPTTTIRFDLPRSSHVSIQIYDVQGRLVKDLINDMKPAGAHAIVWDATNNQAMPVSSGLYYIKMRAGDYQNVKRLMFLK